MDPWVGKIRWRRKWQSTPVLLPGKSLGQRSLVGYSPWGRKELDMTERRSFLHLLLGYKWRHFFVSRVEPTVSPTTNPIAVGPEPVTIVLNKVCLTTLTSIRIVSLTVDELVPVCQVRLESCWCLWGLAWWSSGQDLASLCRGHGFNPWAES